MWRRLAMSLLVCEILACVTITSTVADEVSERCDSKHNRCTTVVQNTQDACHEKCAGAQSCGAACDAEAAKGNKACDAALDLCMDADKKQ